MGCDRGTVLRLQLHQLTSAGISYHIHLHVTFRTHQAVGWTISQRRCSWQSTSLGDVRVGPRWGTRGDTLHSGCALLCLSCPEEHEPHRLWHGLLVPRRVPRPPFPAVLLQVGYTHGSLWTELSTGGFRKNGLRKRLAGDCFLWSSTVRRPNEAREKGHACCPDALPSTLMT